MDGNGRKRINGKRGIRETKKEIEKEVEKDVSLKSCFTIKLLLTMRLTK